jgi:DNA-binding NarL/FixJ family response regulator
MPGRNGLDVLKEVKQARPKLPILVLSMHPEDQYAIRVVKAGASGYLTKETAPEELAKAVRKVLSGGKYISSSLAEKLAVHVETGSDQPVHEQLSDREYQVLCMIGAGKTITDIAKELSLSVKTITSYRRRILDKMHFSNNAELMRYAIENGLTE